MDNTDQTIVRKRERKREREREREGERGVTYHSAQSTVTDGVTVTCGM